MSHDHFHNSPQLHPCNDIAWEQAPQWGKKAKNEVKQEKYHIATCNFWFSLHVSDYVCTLLLHHTNYILITCSCQV